MVLIGATTAAVPAPKASVIELSSNAFMSSVTDIGRSDVLMPRSCAMVISESLVTPSSIESESGAALQTFAERIQVDVFEFLIFKVGGVPYATKQITSTILPRKFSGEFRIGNYFDRGVLLESFFNILDHAVNGKIPRALLAVVSDGNDYLIKYPKAAQHNVFMTFRERIK